MKLLPFLLVLGLTLQSHSVFAAKSAEVTAARDLHRAKVSSVQYYLSLPEGWNMQSAWPIVVTIDGSSHEFAENFHAFVAARGKMPFIIVTPCVTSNGSDPADFEAVLEIVKEVQTEHHGQAKFFMNGFSAGGHLTWQMIYRRPEMLAGAALSAPNFRRRGLEEVSKDPALLTVPVHGFQGDKDKFLPILTEQWANAEAFAKANGRSEIQQDIIHGAPHSPFPEEVLRWFASLLPQKN